MTRPGTSFAPPPPTAAWQHVGARTGFEVVYFEVLGGGYRAEGCTTAVEDGLTWIVSYRIDLDAGWATRAAHLTSRSTAGRRETRVESDGAGRWHVDGEPAPVLDGCLDLDLEASALTNAFPVHRLPLPEGELTQAPAAFVRAPGLQLERLEQTYTRTPEPGTYAYTAPAFGTACALRYDLHGLVVDYPGLARRA